jgi:acyl-CoA reductase-like NAD-dependent aldehyde dehydrogenase
MKAQHVDWTEEVSSLIFENGNYLGPTATVIDLEGVNPNEAITNPAYTEEIFAPVLTIMTVPVPTLDDAIKITNDNPYGNGCDIHEEFSGLKIQINPKYGAHSV